MAHPESEPRIFVQCLVAGVVGLLLGSSAAIVTLSGRDGTFMLFALVGVGLVVGGFGLMVLALGALLNRLSAASPFAFLCTGSLGLLIAAAGHGPAWEYVMQAEHRKAMPIVEALERFASDCGRPVEELDDLIPEYLDALPRPHFQDWSWGVTAAATGELTLVLGVDPRFAHAYRTDGWERRGY